MNKELKEMANHYRSNINENKQKIRGLEWENRELQSDFVRKLVDSGMAEFLLPDWTRIKQFCDR